MLSQKKNHYAKHKSIQYTKWSKIQILTEPEVIYLGFT